MHICVIGAGVIGVSTARALHQRGCRVTVIEALGSPGAVTSFANGAQLSYSFTDPLGSPQLLRALPNIILGRSPGIQIRHKAELAYLQWGAALLWNCLPHQQQRNARRLEQMAQRAGALMESLQTDCSLPFYHKRAGKLILLTQTLSRAQRQGLERKQGAGVDISLVSPEQAQAIEPSLASWQQPYCAALHSKDDAVADAGSFTSLLANKLSKAGVNFIYNQSVDKLR